MVSIEYIAGFFDGEGFVTISKASAKTHSGSRYWLITSIANTHKGVMDEMQKVEGGRVIFHKGDHGWKPHYRLTHYSNQAYVFILKLYPYLVVKKKQADIGIKFMTRNRKHRGPVRLTEEEISFQDKCYQEMKALHGNNITVEAGTITSTF